MTYADTLDKIIEKINSTASRLEEKIPYIPNDRGFYTDTENICWWTNGFWAGMLWQLYHATGNESFGKIAECSEKRLDSALDGFAGIDHDAGFLWLHTAGANYRLTGNKRSERRLLHAASTLAGRFNPDLSIIRAWDGQWMKDHDLAGVAIIDTMMNLPLLYLASDMTGDPRFRSIAMRHADTMLKYMLRPDGSSNHQIAFNIHTGEFVANPGGQGFCSGSSWSRGQAWALYGYALSYLHTGETRYLDASKRSAAYFISNVSMTGYVPLCDFRAPKEPEYFDTTAGAIAACGLLELSEHVNETEKALYKENAVKLLTSLDEKWCDYNTDNDGILGGGSVSYHEKKHHEKIIYGDYFFVEGILRLCGKSFPMW